MCCPPTTSVSAVAIVARIRFWDQNIAGRLGNSAGLAERVRPICISRRYAALYSRRQMASAAAGSNHQAAASMRRNGGTPHYQKCAAGGRSSEPAAVRSHAGPDRAAADTDGIGGWWSSQQRNPSTAGWGKERCCKVGHKWGNFGLGWCEWQTVGSAPDENRLTVSRTSETGVLWRCFRSQKENSGCDTDR